MQKTGTKLPVFFMVIFSMAAICLRFYQLLFLTDSKTGLLTGSDDTTYLLYLSVILFVVCAAFYASRGTCNQPETFVLGKKFVFVSFALCGAFFYDFVRQCYYCYEYVTNARYIESNYLIPLILVCVSALCSSFYFLAVGISQKNMNYDFRGAPFLHFVPVLWLFARLLGVLLKVVNIALGVEIMCEFIYLVFALGFFLCFISTLDGEGKKTSRLLIFFSSVAASMAFVLSVPRILIVLTGRVGTISSVSFFCLTDCIFGIFILAFLGNLLQRKKQI